MISNEEGLDTRRHANTTTASRGCTQRHEQSEKRIVTCCGRVLVLERHTDHPQPQAPLLQASSPEEAPVMIHVFFPAADMTTPWLVPAGDERSTAAACPTLMPRTSTAAGTKLPEARDTAAELAWLTRVREPRGADIGPTNPTAVCIRQARHTTALSAPVETIPRIMIMRLRPVGSGVVGRERREGVS